MKKQNIFIVETPVGIGTIYNLQSIHGNMASIVLTVNSKEDLNYTNSGSFETVIIDCKNELDIDEEIIEKMSSCGFARIIIVKTFIK